MFGQGRAQQTADTKPAGCSSQEADAAGMKCSTAETHTQACQHASTHTSMHTCQHTHKHVRMPAHTQACWHASTHTSMQACQYTYKHAGMPTHTTQCRSFQCKHPLGQRSKVTCIGPKLGEIPICSLAKCQEGDRTGDWPSREDFSSCFSQNPKGFRFSSIPICCPSPPRRLN